MDKPTAEIVANVWRGAMVESVHRAYAVLVDPAGRVVASLGDPTRRTYWRSSAKPFQALPLVLAGGIKSLGLTSKQLAVACGSHAGEPMHVETVRSLLAKARLDESRLCCGAHPPLHGPSAEALRASGAEPARIHCNCSGKHAGMLAQAALAGVTPEEYLDPDHPVQRRIAEVVLELTGVPRDQLAIAVDGCGAPVFGLSLAGMARAYARLAVDGGALGEVRAAMQAHPEMVAGTDRFDTVLMHELGSRLVSKGGAEAVHCLGLCRQGWGFAIKIEDGHPRALPAVVLTALQALGVLGGSLPERLKPFAAPVLRNHEELEVGRIEAIPEVWDAWRRIS